jgi:uncharacterized protein DUF4349
MRRTDENELDPEIAAQLDAIDATLAGEPVDPGHAEIAELALLLTAQRPEIDPGFATSLDQRVQGRFPGRSVDRAPQQAGTGGLRRLWKRSVFEPVAALSAGVAAIVVVVVLASSGGGGSSSSASSSTVAVQDAARPGTSTSASASSSARSPSASSAGSAAANASSSGALGSFVPAARPAQGAPQPVPNGRKIVQSAQLALTTQPDRIDTVAQELYDVVGRENGFVNNSSVTAGGGGYAQFQLSVPSAALQGTMTALSQLRYASVASRTDNVQDVNGQYLSDQRALADARALRTSLLRQLDSATTQAQIDSLKTRLRDAEASIRSDESTLHNLTHKIDYSQVSVAVNSAAGPVAHHHKSGGFTIGKAAHDAGRVLTVLAGVGLIVLAVLLPVGLLAALAWWIGAAIRRRRREQALDLA